MSTIDSGTKINTEYSPLPLLLHSETDRSILTISGAKWKNVEIEGWSFEMSQNAAYALCFIPSENTQGRRLSAIESPFEEGGGLDLEIHFDKKVDICGNDETLMALSREDGVNRSILIRCVPDTKPSISNSFKLTPIAEITSPMRFRLIIQASPSRRLHKLLSFFGNKGEKSEIISINHGDTISLPIETSLTALEDADIGIPVSLIADEPNICSVILCDPETRVWSYEGKGHPSLGVCVWVEITAGKSLRLSKPSLIMAAHPSRRSTKRIKLALTDKVETGRVQ